MSSNILKIKSVTRLIGVMSEGKKRGVGGGGRGQDRRFQSGKTLRFRAPTVGYEDVAFKQGDSPSTFSRNIEKLSSHVATSYKTGGPTIAQAMRTMEPPKTTEPVLPKQPMVADKDNPTEPELKAQIKYEVEQEMYEEKLWQYVRADMVFVENNQKAYNLMVLHIDSAMRTKLEGMADWPTISEAQDGIGLIRLVQSVIWPLSWWP